MSYIMVDVESDGPIPGDYSMVSFGAVIVEPTLSKNFYGQLRPISDKWIPQALAVSGFSREELLDFDEPVVVMERFRDWIKSNSKGDPCSFPTTTASTGSSSTGTSTTSWGKPVRTQFDQPRFALQGRRERHFRQLQASAEDPSFTPSG